MPVHRHLHDRMGSVYASRAELDAWTPSRNLRAAQGNGNDGASPEPRMQPQDTAISTSPPHRGYPTRRILVVAGVAAFLIVSALARKLCSEAREASKDDTLMLDNCAKALGNAGELTESEALAGKKDRLVPAGHPEPEDVSAGDSLYHRERAGKRRCGCGSAVAS